MMMGLVDRDSTHTKFIMLAVIYQVILCCNYVWLYEYFFFCKIPEFTQEFSPYISYATTFNVSYKKAHCSNL
jgi:hypothetical protein